MFSTSTCPSSGSATLVSTIRNCSRVGSPCGRSIKWTSRLRIFYPLGDGNSFRQRVFPVTGLEAPDEHRTLQHVIADDGAVHPHHRQMKKSKRGGQRAAHADQPEERGDQREPRVAGAAQ